MSKSKLSLSKIKREDLKKLLIEGVMEINFLKIDGSMRKMKCTLKSSLIPKNLIPKSRISPYKNLDILVVFDIEKKDWRTISLTRIKTTQVIKV